MRQLIVSGSSRTWSIQLSGSTKFASTGSVYSVRVPTLHCIQEHAPRNQQWLYGHRLCFCNLLTDFKVAMSGQPLGNLPRIRNVEIFTDIVDDISSPYITVSLIPIALAWQGMGALIFVQHSLTTTCVNIANCGRELWIWIGVRTPTEATLLSAHSVRHEPWRSD